MLLSFRFANHRSFRDEQQLSLTPVYADAAAAEAATDLTAVRTVGIFGANASGKSNALSALAFMRDLVLRSDREAEPGMGLPRHPFRLDEASGVAPSTYVVDLLLEQVPHTYGVSLDDERIREEWLYYYPNKRKRVSFERTAESFDTGDSGQKKELSAIADITAPNALFLSTVARFDQRRPSLGLVEGHPLHGVYRWFRAVRSIARNRPRSFVPWPETEDDRQVVSALIRAADVGITDVRLRTPVQDALFAEDIGAELTTTDPSARRRAAAVAQAQSRDRTRLEFAHVGPSGQSIMFGHGDESTGTRQLLDLAIDAANIFRTKGTMMVDEIDASLHPMLTARLIALFQASRTNPNGSQLIFTTHDATLLGTLDGEEVLHRDEVWFTEKDAGGVSTLYPLSNFKPRKEGENRQRRYLNGSYGAVPELSRDVFEQALVARGEIP